MFKEVEEVVNAGKRRADDDEERTRSLVDDEDAARELASPQNPAQPAEGEKNQDQNT